jgi:phage terminase small subunit
MADGLTPRQARFVQEYLLDLNATQAAIRAGYSAHTATTAGPRLLENVEVRRAINAKQARRAKRLDIKAEDVLRGIHRLSKKADSDAVRLRAYELLGKHLRMFADKVEVSGSLSLEQLVLAARKPEGGP